jgi:hypothetical protein
MALSKLTDIQKIARDCYTGNVEKYSKNAANDVLRAEIIERVGGEWNYYNFQKNKWDVYALIGEMISANVSRLSAETFADFCEVKDFALGDRVEFTVKNNDLFKVANIADGINSTRRQRLMGKRIPTTAFKLAIAIYEELDRFLAGRIDWRAMVDNVSASFNQEIANQIAKAMEGAYEQLNSNFVKSGSYSDKELQTLIAKVEAATGQKVTIYGTAEALANVEGADALIDKEDTRNFGFVQLFNGTKMVKINNVYDENTDKWALRNDVLYIIPAGEKIVRLGFEGDVTILEDTTGTSRDDQQIEMLLMRKMHLGILSTAKFGFYEMI